MIKFKITETRLFREVASVIGAKNAERELFIASQCEDCQFNAFDDIWGAFTWCETKQGDKFWRSIATGVNPYEVNCDD